jgi:hypothetical protein
MTLPSKARAREPAGHVPHPGNRKTDTQSAYDGAADFILRGEDVFHFALIAFGPEVRAV